ncbi:hypothetical protein [Duganella violaceipulchra]|uniref:Lauroyl/myristoyl acyltransferase n=1 Tax=Duganella violaceipulchra TaxID=2849652 RepID=A0AA41L469_9BURK|nr:hypothetical protein [Duganella violaceicalia]MBV6322569.1 hypothetical protein [Duganella violaceicalia]MCP2010781.1 lauroyl/myristoyl acyltransferase [Duganella violaceicalia]
MKKILSDLRVVLTPEGKNIVTISEKYFSVSENAAVLLRLIISSPNSDANLLASALSSKIGYSVTEEEINQALDDFPDDFFLTSTQRTKFTFSLPIIKGRILNLFAGFLSPLLHPFLAIPLIFLVGYFLIKFHQDFSMAESGTVETAAFILLGIIFHELGHAAACYSAKVRPGLIGFGFQGVFPSFYTDVSDIWTAGRRQKIVVDLGGIYFQLIYAALLSQFVESNPALVGAVQISVLLALSSALPYFKFDGYWALADFLGKDNLSQWMEIRSSELREKVLSRNLERDDVLSLVGLMSYFLGVVFLCTWIGAHFIKGISSIVMIIAERWPNVMSFDLAAQYMFLVIMVLSTVPMVLSAWRCIIWLVGAGFVVKVKNIAFILKQLLCILTIRLFAPFFYFSSKHRNFMANVAAGVNLVVPKLPKATWVPMQAVVGKYRERAWITLLSTLDTHTGMNLVRRTHEIMSKENLVSVFSTPGAAIIAAPHFGSFVTGALMLMDAAGNERKLHFFYADPEKEPDNAFFEPFYKRYFPDLSVIYNNKRGMVAAARALKNGDIVVILPDVFNSAHNTSVSFLGKDISVMPGIAYFNKKYNARVIPVVSEFSGNLGVRIYVGDDLKLKKSNLELPDDAHVMQEVFTSVEKWVRKSPGDWHCWWKFYYQVSNGMVASN